MNARELLDLIDKHASPHSVRVDGLDVKEIILRALRLLAAAEANDGTTPETDAAFPLSVWPADFACDFARRLERERNGLAVRVAELERIANTRAGRLLLKGKPFVVVANDEPYYPSVYAMIRQREQEVGRWSAEDESAYAAAIDAARGSKP